MKRFTSLFDFFQKVKTDERYKEVARYAYTYYSGTHPTRFRYVDAEIWIKAWAKSNTGDTCERMVKYLNEQMVKLYPIDGEDKKPDDPRIQQDVRDPGEITSQEEIQQLQQEVRNLNRPVITATQQQPTPPSPSEVMNNVEDNLHVEPSIPIIPSA